MIHLSFHLQWNQTIFSTFLVCRAPFVLDWNRHNARMPLWKTYSSLWNLTSSFPTYVMVFHGSRARGHGDTGAVWVLRPVYKQHFQPFHWVKRDNVCPNEWSLVTLSHKGSASTCLIVVGTTSPQEVTWDPILTTCCLCLGKDYTGQCVTGARVLEKRMGPIVGQSERWANYCQQEHFVCSVDNFHTNVAKFISL